MLCLTIRYLISLFIMSQADVEGKLVDILDDEEVGNVSSLCMQ